MTHIKDMPVLSAVPTGGYVLVTDPSSDPTKSIFAKVPAGAVGSGGADLSHALVDDLAGEGGVGGGTPTVKDFGAKGDGATDDTAAFNAAFAALPANSLLFIPAGLYMLSSALTVSASGIRIEGAGKQTTILQMNVATANIINWTGFDGQMENLTLSYSGTPDINAIALNTQSYSGRFRNITLYNTGCGIKCSGNGNTQSFMQIAALNYSGSAIWAAGVGDIWLSHFVFYAGGTEGDNTKAQNGAIRLTDTVEAFTASQGDIMFGEYSLAVSSVVPGRDHCPAFCSFNQVYFDSSASTAAGLGNAILFQFTNCWFAGGRKVGAPGFGCQLTNCLDTTFTGCMFIDNGSHGLVLDTGTTGTRVIGCTFDSNGAMSAPGDAYGVGVVAGVSSFIISGCTFSNNVITTPGAGAGVQGGGVDVLAGASNHYRIESNLFSGLTVANVTDLGTGADKYVETTTGGGGVLTFGKAGTPTTSDIVNGQAAIVKDTTGGSVKLYYNDGGTLKSVALA